MERRTARCLLAALAIGLIVAAAAPTPSAITVAEPLHDALLASMRHGAGFYDAWRDLALSDLATHDARRLPPTLAVATAMLPPWGAVGLVSLAVTAILWAGVARLTPLFARRPGGWLAIALLAIGSAGATLLWAGAPHAGWAAVLVALAVLVRRPGRAVTPAALACIAAAIDPAALWAIAVLAALAWLDSDRREAGAWLLGGAVAAIVLAAHRHALAPMPVADTVTLSDAGGGAARLMAVALPGVPEILAGPLLLLSLLGWSGLAHPLGLRVAALVAVGVAAEGWFALHPATLAAVLVAPGIALAPEALADLIRAAADSRRFTVTRITKREVEG